MVYLPDVKKICKGSSPVERLMLAETQVWPYSSDEGLIPGYVDCGCIYGFEENFYGLSDAFITLPFNTSATLKWRFSGQFLTNTGGTHIGAVGLPDSNDYRVFMQQAGGWTYCDIGNRRFYVRNMDASHTGQVDYAQWSAKTDLDITVWNHALYDNTRDYLIKSGTTATIAPDAEFKLNIHRLRIYAIQAWETSGGTDVLIFDGVPKIRYADNQPGLYDNVGGGFYTNSAATINACYYTLMFKPNYLDYPELSGSTGTTLSLFRNPEYSDDPTHPVLDYIFKDYSGNTIWPTNALTESGSTVCRVEYDSDGWARFKFNTPLYGIYGAIPDPQGKMPFAVIPASVRELYGLFWHQTSIPLPAERMKERIYVPEGVQVIAGQSLSGQWMCANGSIHLPSTLTEIGYSYAFPYSTDYNALYPINGEGPKLFYYNGTLSQYKALTWKGRVSYSGGGVVKYAGYPVKCTDGVFYTPNET